MLPQKALINGRSHVTEISERRFRFRTFLWLVYEDRKREEEEPNVLVGLP